jgi:hypothetical protein
VSHVAIPPSPRGLPLSHAWHQCVRSNRQKLDGRQGHRCSATRNEVFTALVPKSKLPGATCQRTNDYGRPSLRPCGEPPTCRLTAGWHRGVVFRHVRRLGGRGDNDDVKERQKGSLPVGHAARALAIHNNPGGPRAWKSAAAPCKSTRGWCSQLCFRSGIARQLYANATYVCASTGAHSTGTPAGRETVGWRRTGLAPCSPLPAVCADEDLG